MKCLRGAVIVLPLVLSTVGRAEVSDVNSVLTLEASRSLSQLLYHSLDSREISQKDTFDEFEKQTCVTEVREWFDDYGYVGCQARSVCDGNEQGFSPRCVLRFVESKSEESLRITDQRHADDLRSKDPPIQMPWELQLLDAQPDVAPTIGSTGLSSFYTLEASASLSRLLFKVIKFAKTSGVDVGDENEPKHCSTSLHQWSNQYAKVDCQAATTCWYGKAVFSPRCTLHFADWTESKSVSVISENPAEDRLEGDIRSLPWDVRINERPTVP